MSLPIYLYTNKAQQRQERDTNRSWDLVWNNRCSQIALLSPRGIVVFFRLVQKKTAEKQKQQQHQQQQQQQQQQRGESIDAMKKKNNNNNNNINNNNNNNNNNNSSKKKKNEDEDIFLFGDDLPCPFWFQKVGEEDDFSGTNPGIHLFLSICIYSIYLYLFVATLSTHIYSIYSFLLVSILLFIINDVSLCIIMFLYV